MPIVDAVAALRRIGFFADRVGSDAEVSEDLEAAYREMWDRPPAADDPMLDLELLRFDRYRVWWEDTEQDVGAGNDAYVDAIRGWAAISRGALEPSDVRETWDSAAGPIRIDLIHAGRRHELAARYLADYLDLGVLDQLNDIVAASPYRFLLHEAFDQTAFIVVCTDQERRQLEERGWRFARSGAA